MKASSKYEFETDRQIHGHSPEKKKEGHPANRLRMNEEELVILW